MNCKQVSELSTWSQITVSGTTDYLCTKQSDNSLKCSTDPANLTPWNGTITIKQWTTTIWWFNLNDSESQTFTLATWGNSGSSYTLPAATSSTLWGIKIGYYQNGENYPVKLDLNNNAYVTVPREAWSGWSWDSLWKTGTINMGGRTPSVLTPKDTSNGLYLKENVYYDSSLEFWWLNNYGSNRTRQLKLDSAWIRIGESTSTYGYNWVGIWVLWAVWIWTFSNCDSNHLTMFASWNTDSWNFEILWNSRLLVGTYNNSYMYFNNENNVGINTTGVNSTLTINGGVQVASCGNRVCNSSIAWQIRYFESWNTGYFVWCRKQQWNTYKSNVNAANYARINLIDWTNHTTPIPFSSSCSEWVPYNIENYSKVGVQQVTQCSM